MITINNDHDVTGWRLACVPARSRCVRLVIILDPSADGRTIRGVDIEASATSRLGELTRTRSFNIEEKTTR